MSELNAKPLREERSLEDDLEPWFCPNCGKPAPCKVGDIRIVTCLPCGWDFEVRLLKYIGRK